MSEFEWFFGLPDVSADGEADAARLHCLFCFVEKNSLLGF
jgi:hypothetical protein